MKKSLRKLKIAKKAKCYLESTRGSASVNNGRKNDKKNRRHRHGGEPGYATTTQLKKTKGLT